MWTIFKVFIEFVTILLLFYVLVFWPWGMWDQTPPPALEGEVLTIGQPGKSLLFHVLDKKKYIFTLGSKQNDWIYNGIFYFSLYKYKSFKLPLTKWERSQNMYTSEKWIFQVTIRYHWLKSSSLIRKVILWVTDLILQI